MMTRCSPAHFLGWVIRSGTVVKSQAIDIVEVILSRIRRPHIIHTLCRHRKARCELLSTSEAHWFTTKSDGMWENRLLRNQPFPLSLQAQCSRGQLHWPFVNLDAKIPPDVNVLIFS